MREFALQKLSMLVSKLNSKDDSQKQIAEEFFKSIDHKFTTDQIDTLSFEQYNKISSLQQEGAQF